MDKDINIMDIVAYKRKIRKALKKRCDDNLIELLSHFPGNKKEETILENLVSNLRYFTPISFGTLFPFIKEETRTVLIKNLLYNQRFDLADVCLEFGWTPDKELIEEYKKDITKLLLNLIVN
jgi:hypothetical protein